MSLATLSQETLAEIIRISRGRGISGHPLGVFPSRLNPEGPSRRPQRLKAWRALHMEADVGHVFADKWYITEAHGCTRVRFVQLRGDMG